MGCLLYENTHSCKLSVKHFILEYFSDKQLLVGTSVVIEGRLTKAVLCKNEGCNVSEDSQSNPSGGKEKSLPCRQVASNNVAIWLWRLVFSTSVRSIWKVWRNACNQLSLALCFGKQLGLWFGRGARGPASSHHVAAWGKWWIPPAGNRGAFAIQAGREGQHLVALLLQPGLSQLLPFCSRTLW